MMTGCHQSDVWSVGSHLPESTIKRCMYSKTHPSPKSPFCHQTNRTSSQNPRTRNKLEHNESGWFNIIEVSINTKKKLTELKDREGTFFTLISKLAFDRLTIELSVIGLLWLYWWSQIHFQYLFICNLRSISPYIPTLAILNEWIIYYVWNNSDVNYLVEISSHQLLFFDQIHQRHTFKN